MPIPVAERSRAKVFGLSLVEIASSSPSEGMDVCVVRVAKSGQKAKPGQSGQSSTDNVQEREQKRIPTWAWMLCCVL